MVLTEQILSSSEKALSCSHPRMFSGLLTETRNHENHDSDIQQYILLDYFPSDEMSTILCAGCSSIEDPSLEMKVTVTTTEVSSKVNRSRKESLKQEIFLIN